MRRRSYLGAAAGLASAATAGCLEVASSALLGDEPRSDGTLPPCRSFGLGDGDTVCVGERGEPVAVERNTASVSDGGTLVVTVTNEDAAAVGVNSYAWTVFRREDDGWRQVAPDAFPEPRRTLERSESLAWHLRVGAQRSTPDDGDVYIDPLGLDAGGYAFVVVAVVDDVRTELVAPFAVA